MNPEDVINAKLLSQHIFDKLIFEAENTEKKSISHRVMQHLFGLSHTDIIIEKQITISEASLLKLQEITERLNNHEPVQYVLGETEFYGLKILLNRKVLIPRPETEELVHMIINENRESNLIAMDIGTGSGCIALALKKHLKGSRVYGLDISPGALSVASQNANINQLKIEFLAHDVFSEMPELPALDLMVSNPPYVLETEAGSMNKNVLNYEPHGALFVPDKQPLLFYKRILALADKHLKKKGRIYFEINENFGNEMVDLLKDHGFVSIRLVKDMQQKDRFVSGIKS